MPIGASQRKRIFVQDAMKQWRFLSWEFGWSYDPAKVYLRGGNDLSTTATKQLGRFPSVQSHRRNTHGAQKSRK